MRGRRTHARPGPDHLLGGRAGAHIAGDEREARQRGVPHQPHLALQRHPGAVGCACLDVKDGQWIAARVLSLDRQGRRIAIVLVDPVEEMRPDDFARVIPEDSHRRRIGVLNAAPRPDDKNQVGRCVNDLPEVLVVGAEAEVGYIHNVVLAPEFGCYEAWTGLYRKYTDAEYQGIADAVARARSLS